MRVPTTTTQTENNLSPIPISTNSSGTTTNIAIRSFYEPTSVLDPRRSPSPVKDKSSIVKYIQTAPHHPHESGLDWDDQDLNNFDLDSIIKDFGLHDDSAPQQIYEDHVQFVNSDFSVPDVYHNLNYSDEFGKWNSGFDFIEELIQAADCFDSNELQLAQAILARLNHRLQAPSGKPLQRAAFYFKEALQSILSGSNRNGPLRLSSWPEIINTIKAYKAFSGLSPIPMFSHFTANQALVEAFRGSPFIHVIDFDIGLGGQYAAFMKEVAERADAGKALPPMIRITAIVPEEYAIETRLIKENLSQFAHELKIGFHIEFVLIRTFEMSSFKSVKFIDGEKTAVILSPAIFLRLSCGNNISGFLMDLRRISPYVVVFVDNDGWMDGEPSTASFGRNFLSSLEFYTTVFESLDAAVAGGDWVRKIEMYLLRPRILTAIKGGGRQGLLWREVFQAAGMRAVQLSPFAGFQAECLLGRVQVRGFHVARRQAELVLCWHERALVATSAWRF